MLESSVLPLLAGALYQVTDRFFASGLAEGSVSAISYSDRVFNLPLGFAVSPLLIYLSKSSCSVVEKGEAESHLKAALSIGWAYFMPCGMALDWFMASRLGAPGICLATNLVWLLSTSFYVVRLIPALFGQIFPSMVLQTLCALFWIVPLRFLRGESLFSLFWVIPALAVHLVFCEKMGLFGSLLESWRPVMVWNLIMGRIRRSLFLS